MTLLDYAEAAALVGVDETTVRQWKSRRNLWPVANDPRTGRLLFDAEDVLRADAEARQCPAGRKRKGAV